ncbi:MAG TPA: AAA family ATPase [Chitinophagaceae bacterium]
MSEIENLHAEVYDLLIKYRNIDPSLYFTLRRSNRDGRLDKGYWFYGNEGYLALSFWTGTDWKNKTPNIIFVILADTKETYLEINTSDSDAKRKFVVQYLVDTLNLEISGHRYKKEYESYGSDYLESLRHFLLSDKILIDNIIKEYSLTFFDTAEAGINFIEQTDFEERIQKIEKYRDALDQQEIPNTFDPKEKPIKIKEVQIENFGPIRKIRFDEIPFSSQWVFFTGENGVGKTSILRAIAASVCYRRLNDEELNKEMSFKTSITYYLPNSQLRILNRTNNDIPDIAEPVVNGFAAYGPLRLKTNLQSQRDADFFSNNLLSSLFDQDSYLLDLQTQFDIWKFSLSIDYIKRKDFITEILTDILPNLYDIIFDDVVNGISTTSYIEKDNEGGQFQKVSFSNLASGLKSMVAMIGDILIRLYEQQPNVFDPAEFTGIVLIDEIDIHLHPKLQKQLVQQLTKTFPKIQFIATTHSPIPFLGAPKNSSIFKVDRNSESGVLIRRLDHQLELGDLLPNTILTSPIFGFADIVPESHTPGTLIRTEDNFNEMEFNDQVKEKIQDFITDRKEQELINLFKSRRQ